MLKTLFLMVALAMSTRPARADELLIRGALLVDGLGAAPRPSVDILIRDGRIHAIEPRGSIEARGTVIEAAGMTALPGLIDAHVHFVAAPGTGYRNDSDETIAELNRHHLRAYLACGVTTVLDAGSFPAVAREIKSWLAAGNPGPRYLTTGPYVRPPDGWGHPRFGAESTAAEVEAKLDLIEDLGGVGVKIGIERGLAFFGGPRPHPPDVLDAVVRGARRRGLPLYVHAMTEDTQAEALRLRAHAIMHAALNFQAPKDLSPEFVAEIKASGAYQLTTLSIVDTFPGVYDVRRLDDPIMRLVVPSIELETARAPAAREYFLSALIGMGAPWTFRWTRSYLASFLLTESRLTEVLRVSQRNLLRLHRAGVPIVAATDAPSPWPEAILNFHGPQTVRELDLLGQAGFSPIEAIAAATITPATMLGLDAEIGTVQVGKRADLVLVAGNAANDLGALKNIRWTLRDGVARTPEGWMKR